MAPNIGVNVIEVDGRASPTLVAAPISTAGFLVRTRRGVVNQAVNVRGFGDFVAQFGGFASELAGPHAVRGFFDNGGTDAWIVRIADTTGNAPARPARVDLDDRAGTATLRVSAGVRGEPDPGAWANGLAISVEDHPRGASAVPAQIESPTAEPYAGLAGQTLNVLVNGSTTAAGVQFDATDFADPQAATAFEVAAAINRKTAAFGAAATPARTVLLSSTVPGPSSHLSLAGTAVTTLGFAGNPPVTGALTAAQALAVRSTGGFVRGSAVGFETRGRAIGGTAVPATQTLTQAQSFGVQVDGAAATISVTLAAADFAGGLQAATRGEIVAAVNRQGQGRGFSAGLTHDGRLVLMSDRWGPGPGAAVSSIQLSAGAPDATPALGLANATSTAGTRAFATLDAVLEERRLLTWTGGIALDPRFARVQSVEFDLVVEGPDGAELERWESLSLQNTVDHYAETVVNDPAAGSSFIVVDDLGSGSGAGADAPAPVAAVSLDGDISGQDGAPPGQMAYIGDEAARTGLYALDAARVQLLATPDTTSPAVVNAALGYCERRGDAMYVGCPPPGLDLEGIKGYAAPFRGRKVYGALYGPWIQIANPLAGPADDPTIFVPPVGHVLGMYARVGEARGVWKAPAGDEAFLAGALGVEFDMTDADHTDLVKNGSVNGIRAIPGAGVIVDASRSLSTDSRWLFVGVRRLFNFVKSTLRDGLRFAVQQPNSEALRRTVRFNVISPFLLGLWRQGAFGSDPADDVFTVKCDAENNPPAEVNLGIFKVEVYFYPVKPAETIVIVVGQQESGATAAEG